jgi:hypothetical protein
MSDKNDLEIFDDYNKKNYKIFVAKNEDKINFMIKYFDYFNKLNGIRIIGIDLEFNKVSRTNRDVALIQLNLEIESVNEGIIFVLDPRILNDSQIKILVTLLSNIEIIKVLHGGESLDIPYLLNQLFNNDIEIINKFLKNLHDTKYLCEYNHILLKEKKKCSIYELYKELNVITAKKYKYLSNIENIIGPIYLVHIEIKNMSDKVLEYAVYDVLYLVTLYEKIINKSNMLVSEITRNVFFYKRIINKDFIKLNDIVGKFNNYYVIINNENIKLFDIYYYVLYSLNNSLYLNLLEITYFKFFIEVLFKYLVYCEVSLKYSIYKDKNTKSKIDNTIINKIQFSKLFLNFINTFNNEISILL